MQNSEPTLTIEYSAPLSRELSATLTVVLALIFVVGIVGNLLTSVTVIRTKFLRSTTNLFLCNLAISDTLLLVFGGALFDILQLWYQNRSPAAGGQAFCVVRMLLAETASSASVATVVIVTGERYLAICQPLTARSYYLDRRRLGAYVLGVWLLAAVPASCIAYQYGYRPAPTVAWLAPNITVLIEDDHYGFCEIVDPLPWIFETTFLLFFVVPMATIAVAYAAIVRQIRLSLSRQSSNGSEHPLTSQTSHVRARFLVIKMLMVVVTVFFVTHLPIHVQRLMYLHTSAKSLEQKETIQFLCIWYHIAGILQFGGAACNPIMYTAMSKRFRSAFKRLIRMHNSMASSGAVLRNERHAPLEVTAVERRRSISHTPHTPLIC